MTKEKNPMSHREMAAACFNKTWHYLDLIERKSDEVDAMLNVAHTSYWHWTQVPDHTATNLSVGLWMLSRVYAVADLPERATHFAQACISIGQEHKLPPFYAGYGYEAQARAMSRANQSAASESLAKARKLCDAIEDELEKKMLLDDINTINVGSA